MNIAELFVNLGIKGTDKTVGALADTKKGLSGIASTSLEAKAAIVGAMYALERMFAASGAMGTGLANFNSLTGLSARQLQQWQFAARQVGVANEELTGSLKAVQTAMTNMLLGKGAPEGLAMLANKVGFEAKRARDTFYVMQQLQKFAQTAPADVGNAVLKSFGLGEGVIAAMRRNAFTPEMMEKAPTYSDSEIRALDRANVAWGNLGQKIEMAFGRFNAKHGTQLVQDISKITDSVVKLAEALDRVSTKFGILSRIGMMLEGVANSLKLVTEITDKIEGKESKKGDLLYVAPGEEAVPGLKDSPVGKFFRELFGWAEEQKPGQPAPTATPAIAGQPGQKAAPGSPASVIKNQKTSTTSNITKKVSNVTNRSSKSVSNVTNQAGKAGTVKIEQAPAVRGKPGEPKAPVASPRIPAIPPMKQIITPRMPAIPKAPTGTAQNININQNLNFQHEGKDSKQTADSVRKANQDAFRQFAQGQVS